MSKQFESAYDEIIETIDYNEAKEIVNHGCQSGVCSQYIYYADTIKFFDNYEEEITDYIITNYGNDFLVNIFQDSNCYLDMYKNNVCWCYVELICSQIVDEHESTTLEELSNSDWGKDHLVVVNAWLQSLSGFVLLSSSTFS